MSIVPSPNRKMSEMISEMAADFISLGDTAEEKQNRLTAACSAWNMACGSPEERQRMLEQYVEGIKRFNPAQAPGNLANIRREMESLIGRKLHMFPEDKRLIVGAKIVVIGKSFRIEVASASAQ
jgi:hypothetical protein